MKALRLFTGSDGESHFEAIELKFEPERRMETTPMQQAKTVAIRRVSPGVVLDWHPAPRRQYLFTLAGAWEIECGNGEVEKFEPGDVMLADDLTGRGHRSRVVGDQPHVFAAVPLAEQES